MKILFVIDHAPDYRESFFQELGAHADLTVVAQPCEPEGLTPPPVRNGYRYIEIPGLKIFGVVWQSGLSRLVHRSSWDVLCFDLNLRHVERTLLFLKEKAYRSRWVWWGHIIGRNHSMLADYMRRFMLLRSAGCLAYSKKIVEDVKTRYGVDTISLNNTQIRQDDFRIGKFDNHPEIRFLFVGRYQSRKRLERLVALSMRRSDIYVQLVGPGMETMRIPDELISSGRLKIFPRTVGKNLNPHFDWADIVANPGHVGLLVMNTAQHGKGIVIDSDSHHAPEYWLAKESEQPFISFGSQNEVDCFINKIKQNRRKLYEYGNRLQNVARQNYTIESMARVHISNFEKIISKNNITQKKIIYD